MKIALAQLNYTVGDVAGNTNKIIESVRRAKAEGADLVVFAEQAISGAPSFDLLRKNPFLEQCEDALMRIAAECGYPVVYHATCFRISRIPIISPLYSTCILP